MAKYLITVFMSFFLIGCGVDPDDYQAEKADGCKSYDIECQAENEKEEDEKEKSESAAIEDSEKQGDQNDNLDKEVSNESMPEGFKDEKGVYRNQDFVDENCEVNKLCRGASKEYVLDILGQPDTIEKGLKGETWKWQEFGGEAARYICGSYTCEIEFRNDFLFGQINIDANWIDLANF